MTKKPPEPPKLSIVALGAKKPAARPTRVRPDRDAIERDYRTGKFTLRELEAKHGANNAQIARWVKKLGWSKDLSDAVRQATNARLIEQIVSNDIADGQQKVSSAVFEAAQVNVQIVLGHRQWLQDLAADALAARAKLLMLAESAADIREANVVLQGIEASGRTIKAVIEGQRKAFGLDEINAADPTPKPPPNMTEVAPEEAGEVYLRWANGK